MCQAHELAIQDMREIEGKRDQRIEKVYKKYEPKFKSKHQQKRDSRECFKLY